MINRVHITGQARGGTTLLKNLLGACFENTVSFPVETHYHLGQTTPGKVLISHCASDCNSLDSVQRMLSVPDMGIIFMIRDIRDSMVSKMPTGSYHLRKETAEHLPALPLMECSALVLKYEDLVASPEEVQSRIGAFFGLTTSRSFLEGYKYFPGEAKDNTQHYMGGIRPIGSSSVGGWKTHKDRKEVERIVEENPHIKDFLVDYGYEV